MMMVTYVPTCCWLVRRNTWTSTPHPPSRCRWTPWWSSYPACMISWDCGRHTTSTNCAASGGWCSMNYISWWCWCYTRPEYWMILTHPELFVAPFGQPIRIVNTSPSICSNRYSPSEATTTVSTTTAWIESRTEPKRGWLDTSSKWRPTWWPPSCNSTGC